MGLCELLNEVNTDATWSRGEISADADVGPVMAGLEWLAWMPACDENDSDVATSCERNIAVAALTAP